MKITCVITDDEPVARKGLKGYVEEIEFLELSAVCRDANELEVFLNENTVDLLFLDIEMPYRSGLAVLQSLSAPPKVIFTTAFEKYAINGYDLDIVDFLLKPISFDRFLKASNKALALIKQEREIENDAFFIKTEGKLLKLSWKEILFIEGMENYIGIHTANKKHMVLMTLKAVLMKMPVAFIQIHKSYVLNTEMITSIDGNIISIGDHQLNMSRTFKEGLRSRLMGSKSLNEKLLSR